MCGICGKLSWDNPPDTALIKRMNDRLVHRGPDAEGIHIAGPLGLGHRRLSIIDLSAAGNQPMSDHTGQYWIVFNGEIYNFQELRDELLKLGAHFRTRTDTEVILEAYKQWGTQCLERFNGMFAFALWDGRAQQLMLARDRLGEKPLYYYALPDGGIIFASELKALRADPAVPDQINIKALSHYLSLNYTLTAESILQGVKKLEAAHYMMVERGKPVRATRYWDLAAHFHNKRHFRSEAEAAEALSALIEDAVKLRMIADVPLGAFLSGGIDSSTIVAAMCRLRAPSENHTFSIGFREKSYSELPEARFVADYLKVSHHEKIVDADMAALLPRIVWHADEPFADTSMIPMYFLAEQARQLVTVCLSGDGADEIFAGYETYTADKIHNFTRRLPAWVVKMTERSVNTLVPVSFDKVSLDYKLRQFLKGQAFEPIRAHYSWRTIFSEEEKRALLPDYRAQLSEADPFEYFRKYHQEVAGCHYIDQAMYVDIKTWLVDDILLKVDRSTMAHSLEARVPMLDHRLVEFAASLPVELKLKGFEKKYLLKKAQQGYLPDMTLRRRKRGFNAPVSHWLYTTLGNFCAKLTVPGTNGWAAFNSEFINSLYQAHEGRRQDNSLKLLSLINYHLWRYQN